MREVYAIRPVDLAWPDESPARLYMRLFGRRFFRRRRHRHRCESCGCVWSHYKPDPKVDSDPYHLCPRCGRGPTFRVFTGKVKTDFLDPDPALAIAAGGLMLRAWRKIRPLIKRLTDAF